MWITTNKKDSKMSYSQSYPHYPQYVDKNEVNKKDNIKQKTKRIFKYKNKATNKNKNRNKRKTIAKKD